MSVSTLWLEVQEAGWLEQERARLVRVCTRMTGRPEVGEDLAQECLLEALRHQQELREPERLQAWLMGIARNVSLRWLRAQGREQQRRFTFASGQNENDETMEEQLVDSYDFEIDLERKELIELLDRALALLPEEVRMLLIEKYVHESSLSEVAQRLNMQSGAVAMRLQRGRLAFQKVLQTHFQEEISPYLLPTMNQGFLQKTSVWCPVCGKRQLEVKMEPGGNMILRCAQCTGRDNCVFSLTNEVIGGAKSYRKAMGRGLDWVYGIYQHIKTHSMLSCPECGEAISVQNLFPHLPPWSAPMPEWLKPEPYGFYMYCYRCSCWISIPHVSIVWSLPEGRKFWQEHPKMRLGSTQAIEIAGRMGVVSTIESMTDSEKLTVILDQNTHEIIRIID